MFTFFHRSSVINIDCFTYITEAYNLTPIINANKAKPEYQKQLPNLDISNTENWFENKGTSRNLKSCFGFLEFFKQGVVIENWCDLAVKSNEEHISYFSSTGMIPEMHHHSQLGKGFENHYCVKLKSPWKLSTKEKVKFLMVGAEWNLDRYNIKIPPGILDLRVTNATNIFLMCPKVYQSFIIPIGNPLVHIIPLDDRKIKVTNHLLSPDEYNKITITSNISMYGWRKILSLRKRNENRDKKNKKCPFGFGD